VRRWLTRKRIVWLGIALAVVFLLADAFVATPAHDVHTPGATQLAATLINSDIRGSFAAVQPSESISDLRCHVWHAHHSAMQCPDDIAGTIFPSVTQTPNTLYLIWMGCISWHGYGEIISWQGYNLEYLPPSRRLLIHCYVSEPWITHHQTLFGVAAVPSASLLVVPTGPMGPGRVQVVEDDRLEHLVGDQSTEFQLATATIS
jgi:hypothetical protein